MKRANTEGPPSTDGLSAQSVRSGTKILSRISARRVNTVNEIADSEGMTQTRKTLTLFAVLAYVAIGAILAGTALATVSADRMVPAYTAAPAPVQVTTQVHRIDAIPAEVEGTEPLTGDQYAAAQAAADRICEGMTAGVPLYLMDTAIAEEGGLSLEQAHQFVTTAAQACLAGS